MEISLARFKGGDALPARGVAGIYTIRHEASGKVYVGSAVSLYDRLYNHLWHLERGTHKNAKLRFAWRKHGLSSFCCEVLEVVPNTANLIEREQHWIDLLKACTQGYNLNPKAASCLGVKHSEKTRRAVAAGARRAMADPEVKARHRAATRRAMASPDVRERIQASARARYADPEKKAAAVAIQRLPEVREKKRQGVLLSCARRGIGQTPKVRPGRGKQYEVVFPDGTVEIVKNLKGFCQAHGLSYSGAQHTANGRMETARGYGIQMVGKPRPYPRTVPDKKEKLELQPFRVARICQSPDGSNRNGRSKRFAWLRELRKPADAPAAGVDVDALIAKGGSVAVPAGEPVADQAAVTSFTLRVPADIVAQLDEKRKARRPKVSRQQWILEAIVQRIDEG